MTVETPAVDAFPRRVSGRVRNRSRGRGLEPVRLGAGVKRLGELVPTLIALGLIVALIAGAVAIANELLTQIDRW